jgi:hypothetical protein
MDQNDRLIAETGNPGRTVGDHLGDIQRLRNWLIGGSGESADVPSPSSPLGMMYAACAGTMGLTVQLSDAQMADLASRIVAGLASVVVPVDTAALASQVVSELAPMMAPVAELSQQLTGIGEALVGTNDGEVGD